MSPGGLSHLGLNLLYLVPRETGGMETYARGLVPALAEARPELRITAFVNDDAAEQLRRAPWLQAAEVVRVGRGGRNRYLRTGSELALLARAARRAGVELLHSLGNTAPPLLGTPGVVTVHDLIHRRFPDAHTRAMAAGMRVLVPLAVYRSRLVITPSEASRRDVIELLGTPPEKVLVVPNGFGARPVEAPADAAAAARRRYVPDGAPLVLTLSARRTHKNLGRLLEALALIDHAPAPVLVVPGYESGFESEVEERARELGVGERLRLLGWLAEQELEALFAACDAFVFPSLMEGFGFPVLEAMARGVPVACSKASSLPEVAGDAALLFDPERPEAIAAAIERLLDDTALREELVLRGRERAASFSWRRAAEATLAAYEWVLSLPD